MTQEIRDVLTQARAYVETANYEAEARHDNEGGDYCDYQTMQETEALLQKIDELLKQE